MGWNNPILLIVYLIYEWPPKLLTFHWFGNVYPNLFLERYVVCMLYKNIAELIPEQDNRLVDREILPLYNSKWTPKFAHTDCSPPPFLSLLFKFYKIYALSTEDTLNV